VDLQGQAGKAVRIQVTRVKGDLVDDFGRLRRQ
jgi:hypothetical protein